MNWSVLFIWLTLLVATADSATVQWYYGSGQPVLKVRPGETISFMYNLPHTVTQFANAAAYNKCDFTGAKTICTKSTGYEDVGCVVKAPSKSGTYYYGSAKPIYDCSRGLMKVKVIVS